MSTPHWKDHWHDIAAQLASRRRLLLACDFDGTLAPIAARPEEAVLPEGMRTLLEKFAAWPGVTLAFVSGRALGDVRTREGPDFAWTSPEAIQRRSAVGAAVAELRSATAGMSGVLIEDKGLTATVHWRMASEESREALRPLVATAVESHAGLRLGHGKAVWELRPRVSWDKGAALRHLLIRARLERGSALFLGDDETDESAFRTLADGVTVRVGEPAATAARYRARDVSDAAGFLFCLFAARTGGSGAPATLLPFPATAAA
jgi:trehalose 6-phosphate phosphatase